MTDTPSAIRFDASNVEPDVPVVEIEVTTRYQEARAAMAVVATLREHGVPVRDIVVVARDLDGYEEPIVATDTLFPVIPEIEHIDPCNFG